jgi:phage terminase large subunit
LGETRVVEIKSPYAPRKAFMPFHNREKRWAVMVCHRRAGKTVACINDLIAHAAGCELHKPRFAYISPYFNQSKQTAWDYLKQYTDCIPGRQWHESELRADLPGDARVRLYGADNPDRLRGIYLDGVVLDEYGDMDPRVWTSVLRPALADRGGWAVFIGTPKGRNHFADAWDAALIDPEYYTLMLRASDSGILSIPELDAAKRIMQPEEYEAEFECSFSAGARGAFYAKLLEESEQAKRIAHIAWEPRQPVYTAWDLGIDDATAIWVAQTVGREVRVIDYYESANQPAAHYVNWVMGGGTAKCKWTFAEHFLPHDGGDREKSTGMTYQDAVETLGLRNVTVLPRLAKLETGIHAAQMFMPKCWFDAQHCKQGLTALRSYRREWDEERKVLSLKPVHDWSSHAADAYRYLVQGLSGATIGGWQKIEYPRQAYA